ncbi:MAG TPA: membrane protein insertase YidC [Longimicrobiales bacterium]|nr:membrane protein insertase YidC [Longimicrobiales bacterium]
MDTRRFLLAIVLMIAVIVVTNLLFPPAPPELPDEATEEITTPVMAPSGDAMLPAAEPQPAGPEQVVAVDTIDVASPLYRFGVSTAGGSIVSAELLQFESFTPDAPDSMPVELAEQGIGPLVRYTLQAGGSTVALDTIAFALVEDTGDTLRLSYANPVTGVSVELNYAFRPHTYLVDVWGSARAGAGAPGVFGVQLGPTLRVNERNAQDDFRALAYVVNSRDHGIRSVQLDDVESERIEEGPLAWVAIKNKYFVVAALSPFGEPPERLGGAIVQPVPLEHAAALTATVPLESDGSFAFQLYLGPQQFDHLTAAGRSLEDVNPYGWRVFRPIIRPLARFVTWALVGMHNILGLGYGWVLIIFGILVRGVMWPLNARAMRSQLKNMELQPRMKEIQTKYRNDPEQLQREMLRLYKEEGFNPLGGCLPMLIPFPVLITLFFVFQSTIEFRGVEFLWLPDLSQRDPFFILPVLLAASMFVMQWLSMRSTPVPNPQMKMMMWFMPGLMLVIFLNLASGLNLYYFSLNMASIPQQLQIMRERQRVQGRIKTTGAGTGSRAPAGGAVKGAQEARTGGGGTSQSQRKSKRKRG